MFDIRLDVYGIADIEAALGAIGRPAFQARMLGPSLGAMASIVRAKAKRRGFGFRDRRSSLGYPPELNTGTFRDLRATIRSRRIAARYGGQRFKSGRAAVFAGGSGARQAFLVHEGHGGPRPARPKRFLRKALLQSRAGMEQAFIATMRRRFPAMAASIARVSRTRSIQASYARTVSRRARRR